MAGRRWDGAQGIRVEARQPNPLRARGHGAALAPLIVPIRASDRRAILWKAIGAPNGTRTRVFAVKGRRPGPLDDGRNTNHPRTPGGSGARGCYTGAGRRTQEARHPIPAEERVFRGCALSRRRSAAGPRFNPRSDAVFGAIDFRQGAKTNRRRPQLDQPISCREKAASGRNAFTGTLEAESVRMNRTASSLFRRSSVASECAPRFRERNPCAEPSIAPFLVSGKIEE